MDYDVYMHDLVGLVIIFKKAQDHRKRSLDEKLVGFLCWRIYRLFLFGEDLPFYIWFYSPLLDYDVSLHDLVELFIAVPTSPRSSKSESG